MPGTYTGSIGVVMGRFNVAETYEKLGVGNSAVKRGRNADIFDESRPLTDEQRQRLQNSVDTTYAAFLEKVAEARGMELRDVEALASGRVWTGRQALERGLIDEIGGLRAALSVARREADLAPGTDTAIVVYPQQPGLFEQLRGVMFASQAKIEASTSAEPLDQLAARFDLVRWLRAGGQAWALSDLAVPSALP